LKISPNPVTTAKLNQRLGYIYWRLIEANLTVHRYNVNTVRKHLEITGKKSGEQKKLLRKKVNHATGLTFTPDETDAIALLMFHVGERFSDLDKYQISRRKRKLEDVSKTNR
jgi:Holliday junction resolvasome RuvABC endonuclease subunit